MPLFFKNVKSKQIRWLLSFKAVRFFILLLGYFWTKEIIRQTEFHAPDLIMASNIYAAPFVKMLAGMSVPAIYDMNDDHLSFPNTPAWAKIYFESLCLVASRIVVPAASMIKLLPIWAKTGVKIITNGVDCSAFESRRIILYIGAVAEWVDTELLEKVAENFPNETLRLIGPVSTDVMRFGRFPNVEFIGSLPCQIVAEQIKQAAICLIPFKQCDITAHTANINKVFEYFAAGKPIVTIGRPLSEFEENHRGAAYAAETHDQFVAAISRALYENDCMVDARRRFASENDWEKKSAEMVNLIKAVTANKEH